MTAKGAKPLAVGQRVGVALAYVWPPSAGWTSTATGPLLGTLALLDSEATVVLDSGATVRVPLTAVEEPPSRAGEEPPSRAGEEPPSRAGEAAP